MKKIFVGFGFGAIQSGLFLYEAYCSGNFETLVVAEVMPDAVTELRAARGRYSINIAGDRGIEQQSVENVVILNPNDSSDKAKLLEYIAEADEIATALPSVDFFTKGGTASVARLIAEGLSASGRHQDKQTIVYAAENHNHAAEILETAVSNETENPGILRNVQFLNTVIGKMSGVVTDRKQIEEQSLAPVTADAARCFLVERFNRILIAQVSLPGFKRGISVFEEKQDLLPFEYAKLYGHNAVHALLGYLAAEKSYLFMDQVQNDKQLLKTGRIAFINESGAALIKKFTGTDSLFTEQGYREYAEDLLVRMMNPHLRDAVERVTRDPLRKLGWDDRLTGVIRLALSHNIQPVNFAKGAIAAIRMLSQNLGSDPWPALEETWSKSGAQNNEIREIKNFMENSATA